MYTLSCNCLNTLLTAAKIIATIRKNCKDIKLISQCIKPRIQERGTECGERGEWGECYIPGNVPKHPGECRQTFRGMSSNIPGNVAKYSGKCRQTFREISSNISGNALKQSREYSKIIWGML